MSRGVRILIALLLALCSGRLSAGALEPQRRGAVELVPCPVPGTSRQMLCGAFQVPEDPARPGGRTLDLRIAVIPARSARPRPDPILFLAGGPGGSAVAAAGGFVRSKLRRKRDIVLVDQRGTGESNPLQCEVPGSAEDLQGYLDGTFARVGPFRRCKRVLKRVAKLPLYTSIQAVDDLEAVRSAMGYERVDLLGRSWGSRTALIYLRRHPETVRSAVLESTVPLAITYPLYHARGAQEAVDALFERCAVDARCTAAFPDPAGDLHSALASLAGRRVPVTISHPDTGERVEVALTSRALGEGIRWLMFAAPEYLPALVHLASAGDWEPITQFTVDYAHLLGNLKIGLLLSEVCSTDVPRIDAADIPRLTDGTFMGDARVRELRRICRIWPHAPLPAGFGDPVATDVPILLWTGAFDSASRPGWVDEAAAFLPESLHLVVDAAHTPDGRCVDTVTRRFFDSASVHGLRTGCTRRIDLPPFVVP